MRGRVVGIIVGAAVLWTVAPLSASATGCEADADADVAVPGDKSASVEGGCSVSGGPDVRVEVNGFPRHEEEQGADAYYFQPIDVESDLDGDGQNDVATGDPYVKLYCPQPEEQGVVTALVCPILQAT